MRFSSTIAFLLTTIAFANICDVAPIVSDVLASDTANRAEIYLRAAESVFDFTGTAVIAKDGEIVFAGGFGKADLESGRPNSPTTRFQIGSITKQFTAAAIMQLQEKGLLNVTDSLYKYFPDLPDFMAKRVTIHHLLAHTSGIANYTAVPAFTNIVKTDPPLDEMITLISTLPVQFEPGSKYEYSNSGYKLLEGIIVQLSGQSWKDYIETNILEPLAMSATGYDILTVDEHLRAVGYTKKGDKRERAELWPAGVAGGAGALYSTVLDMIKWDRALADESILKQSSLNSMFSPEHSNYGYGLIIDSIGSYQRIWHDGLIAGFSAVFIRIPSEELCCVVLCNDDTAPTYRFASTITDIALKRPYDLPVKKQPIAIDTSLFAEYAGAYSIDDSTYRFVTVERSQLMSQRSGGPQFRLYPESDDKFYFENDNSVTISFLRDSSGRVKSHVLHSQGADTEHQKLSDSLSIALMPKYVIADVDPEIYSAYEGEYQITPDFTITVRRRENQLFAQATRQPEFEIYPSSEAKFFLKVVDAQIEFFRDASGKVDKLILYQGGQEISAAKIK